MIGIHPDELSQGTIDAKDVAGFAMNNDEIADGVKDFDPVAVRVFQPLGRHGGLQDCGNMRCQRLKPAAVRGHPVGTAPRQNEESYELALGIFKARQDNLVPLQS